MLRGAHRCSTNPARRLRGARAPGRAAGPGGLRACGSETPEGETIGRIARERGFVAMSEPARAITFETQRRRLALCVVDARVSPEAYRLAPVRRE
jgi:hypothetical protein